MQSHLKSLASAGPSGELMSGRYSSEPLCRRVSTLHPVVCFRRALTYSRASNMSLSSRAQKNNFTPTKVVMLAGPRHGPAHGMKPCWFYPVLGSVFNGVAHNPRIRDNAEVGCRQSEQWFNSQRHRKFQLPQVQLPTETGVTESPGQEKSTTSSSKDLARGPRSTNG
ncbi:hypothetical protein BT67DRAFT_119502 [Trichocladium antarcticum]|uniref:Uncharacterized protein n=1 Tax=Trichocladium antarcticum TaxID=1450529 RepID=A0AAN6UTS1_9PEZI|nr:hypothetical protein BT67DRAFT_119502 [Trichocladium antarcticum]